MSFLDGYRTVLLTSFMTMGAFSSIASVFALIAWVIALCKGIRKTAYTEEALRFSFAIPITLATIFIFMRLMSMELPPFPPGPRGETLGILVFMNSPVAYACGAITIFVLFGLYGWLAHFVSKKGVKWLKVDTTEEERREAERNRFQTACASRRGGD